MVSNKQVKQLINKCESAMYIPSKNRPLPQIFRGVSSLHWKNNPCVDVPNCQRHRLLFVTENIIPEYCFDCYKIQIKPKTVIELFKLMILFDEISLPDDNTRKCYVELRPNVAGTYSGLIYFQSLQDAKDTLPLITQTVAEQISSDIEIILKRGCSEYPIAYPEYGKLDSDNNPIMHPKSSWIKKEAAFDKKGLTSHLSPLNFDSYNAADFNIIDIKVMLVWLRYASTIGDTSYREYTNITLPKIPNLNRPSS